MILYQDSDSIVKRFLRDELGVKEIEDSVNKADVIATSLVSYVEVRAALIRARRANRIRRQDDYRLFVQSLDEDWPHFFKISGTPSLVRNAGQLAEGHALKGADAIHLASALQLNKRIADALALSTWDKRLALAAQAEGLSLAHEVTT